MINSNEQLLSVLATLEACRATLVASGDRDTAQLVSVAVLELRMKLNAIDDEDLKALCDELVSDEEARTERVREFETVIGPSPSALVAPRQVATSFSGATNRPARDRRDVVFVIDESHPRAIPR